MSDQNDQLLGRQRERAQRGQDDPTRPVERVNTTYLPAQKFENWDVILPQVRQEVNALMQDPKYKREVLVRTEVFGPLAQRMIEAHARTWNVRREQYAELTGYLHKELFGYGAMSTWLEDPEVEDILLNNWQWMDIIKRGAKHPIKPTPFKSDREVNEWLQTVVFQPVGKEFNRSNPAENAVLRDGSRVFAFRNPIAEHTGFAIRRHRKEVFQKPEDYINTGIAPVSFFKDLKEWTEGKRTMVVAGATGSGKAQPLDARIATPTGWTTMGELQVGDPVLDVHGHTQTVEGVYPQGELPIVAVTFADGTTVQCCTEHLWNVRDTAGQLLDRPWQTLPLHEIRERFDNEGEIWYVPVAAPVNFQPTTALTAVRELGNEVGNSYSLSAGQSVVATSTLVPDAYMLGSIAERWELLHGIQEACGEGTADLVTVLGYEFAQQVVELVQSLGGLARLRGGERRGMPVWEIDLRFPEEGSALAREIVAIETVGRAQAQCIRVSSADQLYLTEGYIVTHNTTFINFAGSLVPRDERIITLEDTPELQINHPRVLPLTTSESGARAGETGDKDIPMRDLLRYSLRLKPDRIIVGETRDAEAFDMLDALNTGHAGSFTSLHSNSTTDAITRLQTMAVRAAFDYPISALQDLIASVIDIVLHIRNIDGVRRVAQVDQVLYRHHFTDFEHQKNMKLIYPNLGMLPLWQWNREQEALLRVGEYLLPDHE
jgi:Flp pilus assembly CpaF family ATPase